MEFLYEYGLFLAKAVTLVVAILVVVGGIAALAMRQKPHKGELQITDIGRRLDKIQNKIAESVLSKHALKHREKEQKKQRKAEEKASKKEDSKENETGRLYVIDFKGSIDAHEVEALREEVTAVLTIADKEHDEVLIRLESGGGMVHGYGLASSQLARLREAGIKLTACVDKVAASGGYMMASVADKVLAAPFAVVGSIGVIAQLPNFNKLLKKHDIDYEQVTAGEYKRTLTIFGENTEKARVKFQQELEETHLLFKEYVKEYRPSLDIEQVATGEHWFGKQALALGLIDDISTSDDYVMNAAQEKDVFSLKFITKKKLSDKISEGVMHAFERITQRF